MEKRQHIKDFEYTRAKDINEYLKSVPTNIREKIIEVIMDDICIHCSDVNEGVCHCMNDD